MAGVADLGVDERRARVVLAMLAEPDDPVTGALLRRQGEVLSRTEIAEQVWDINFDSNTNVVEVAVRRLRGKVDDPFEKKLLHTVRGMGYVLEQREGEVA